MQAIGPRTDAATDALADDLYTLLQFVLKTTQGDLFRALEGMQFSFTQMKLLMTLDAHAEEPCALSRVGETLGISLPACSRAVDALHQRGLVARREDPTDRRVKRVEITDAGRAMLQQILNVRLAAIAQFTETLSPTDQHRLTDALAPLLARPEIAACRPERTPSS